MDFIKVDSKITLSPLTKEDFPIFIDRINDYEIYTDLKNKNILSNIIQLE